MTKHTPARLILLALVFYATSAFPQSTAEDATIKGTVVDAAGASVAQARVRIVDANDKVAAEALTDQEGRFELSSPTKPVTLVVEARGFDRFQRPLHLTHKAVETLDVTLTLGCLPEIEHIIPLKPDLRNFLVEIHYRGSFGDCPERVYRLWGTGEASITYSGCSGTTLKETRQVGQEVVAATLAELAKKYPGPTCNYFHGGIDAATVEFTVISGSEPGIVISHDQGDKIDGVTPIEKTLESLIDPDKHMQSFGKKADKTKTPEASH